MRKDQQEGCGGDEEEGRRINKKFMKCYKRQKSIIAKINIRSMLLPQVTECEVPKLAKRTRTGL